MQKLLSLFSIAVLLTGCAAANLAGYALFPDYPTVARGSHTLAGLQAPVKAVMDQDGLWHLRAENEHDLMFMTGYLQARDRFAQMDIFRHLALGRLSELVGDVAFGDKSSVEADLFNRALDFAGQGRYLYERSSPEERAAIDAFAAGVNAWIAEGYVPLEHRLLGAGPLAPWHAEDSLAIYQMLMYNLSSNANREIRRLLLACAAGIAAAERIWPSGIDFKVPALPAEHIAPVTYAVAPAVVPELAAELDAQCADAAGAPVRAGRAANAPGPLAHLFSGLSQGWSASNSWAVAGSRTASGKPVLANDPHLPHMNPPILWGIDQQGPEYRTAGFTLPGIHRVVFGHNGHVAWSATTNHVDRQDLVVLRPALVDESGRAAGYEFEGAAVPFTEVTLAIRVKGGEARKFQVRYGADGPVLNDIELSLPGPIPLTALRQAGRGAGGDLDAARGLAYARSAEDFVASIRMMDGGCTNWVYVTAAGDIGYESPCVLPVREGYSGAFPVAGWLAKYRWKGYVDKRELPASRNPAQGWIATANSRVVPPESFPTAYNNDPSEPNRYERAAALLKNAAAYSVTDAVAMQIDVQDAGWPRVRAALDEPLCRQEDGFGAPEAKALLCGWDGHSDSESSAVTLFVLFSNALLDRALADEVPSGSQSALWSYVQGIPMFEANANWLWVRADEDPVWDDAATPEKETKPVIIRAAFQDAVRQARARFGDNVADWQWGTAAPFRVRHLFAGKDGVLGAVLNSHALPGIGLPTTLYKNQFNRSDREFFRATLGPSIRFVIDMADPWAATYTLAGGQSGWPRSSHFADAVDDWRTGTQRPITGSAAGLPVEFKPTAWETAR